MATTAVPSPGWPALGLPARIYVPDGVHESAIRAIENKRASVTHVAGCYDDAVACAAGDAAKSGAALVEDTAWDGYTEIPGRIVEGYATLFSELDTQLGAAPPDLVVVPVGVGSLVQAAVTHYRRAGLHYLPAMLSVEPDTAWCLLAVLQRDEQTSVGTGRTIKAGHRCSWQPERTDRMTVIALVSELVAIDSLNSSLDEGGAGEARIAEFVSSWADDAGRSSKSSNRRLDGRASSCAAVPPAGRHGCPTVTRRTPSRLVRARIAWGRSGSPHARHQSVCPDISLTSPRRDVRSFEVLRINQHGQPRRVHVPLDARILLFGRLLAGLSDSSATRSSRRDDRLSGRWEGRGG